MKRIALSIMLMAVMLPASAKSIGISSPDGNYVMNLKDEAGRVTYDLSWKGRKIISNSTLGIMAGTSWHDGLAFGECVNEGEHDSSWRPAYGERAVIRDHYNAMRIPVIKSLDGRQATVVLELRAYDEGIAFRYCFTGNQYLRITDEFTEFTVPEGTMAYFTPRAQTPYSLLPLRDWPGNGESERPLLLRLPGSGFLCLGEADVVDYVRTKFSLGGSPDTIRMSMYGPVEEIAPYNTPWRLMMCGEKAGDILANNFIYYNLNPECRIRDCSWIRPGKVMREVTLTTEGGMALVDFAERHNLQYIHFDAGWYGSEYSKASDATTVTLDPARNPDIDALDLRSVIAYARSKGIGVILYVNQRALQQQLDEILPLYKEWGVAGIKFGFVQVGSQVWTKWMHEAVARCAEYGLMVDIHDEYRPTGVSRTYPNLMTQEGVRGNEEFPDAFNNTVLPFTRFVCGPADYTICYYRQDFDRLASPGESHGAPKPKTLQTTPAHQLALSVVYYSPFQFMYWYDTPSDCQDEPELKFFDDVWTVWDDTRILEGEPGGYITVARRHGEEWFVGTIANQGRRAEVALDFLEPGDYVAEIYTDGPASLPTRTKVQVSRCRADACTTLRFDIRSAGGAAIRLVPEHELDKSLKAVKKKQIF